MGYFIMRNRGPKEGALGGARKSEIAGSQSDAERILADVKTFGGAYTRGGEWARVWNASNWAYSHNGARQIKAVRSFMHAGYLHVRAEVTRKGGEGRIDLLLDISIASEGGAQGTTITREFAFIEADAKRDADRREALIMDLINRNVRNLTADEADMLAQGAQGIEARRIAEGQARAELREAKARAEEQGRAASKRAEREAKGKADADKRQSKEGVAMAMAHVRSSVKVARQTSEADKGTKTAEADEADEGAE